MCSYIINVEGADHITISFNEFEVEYRHDFLHYGIGTEPSIEKAIGHFTSYYPPADFSLPTSSMWFLLETDGSAGADMGFELTWDTTAGNSAS